MARVQVDDAYYMMACDVLASYESDGIRVGAGEAFHDYLRGFPEAHLTQDDRAACSLALAAMLGHQDGTSAAMNAIEGRRGDEIRCVVWSFYRAWVDSYGRVHAKV